MKPLLVLPYAEASAGFNMGFDAALLASPPEHPVLRFYGWQPATITLGRFQQVERDWIAALRAQGLAVTRRTTGGGAILHAGELTYSLTARMGSEGLGIDRRPESAYRLIHGALIEAIGDAAKLGQGALFMRDQIDPTPEDEGGERVMCFSRRTRFDVLFDWKRAQATEGRELIASAAVDVLRDSLPLDAELPASAKLIGSAQRRRGDVLLQHGSIKLARSPLAPWAGSIADLAGQAPALDALCDSISRALADRLGRAAETSATPIDALRDDALRIAAARFERDAWVVEGKR